MMLLNGQTVRQLDGFTVSPSSLSHRPHCLTAIGDRRDHYAPELEIKKIITGFLKEQVEPHLESGEGRLKALDEQKEEVPKEIQKRIKRLGAWRGRAEKLLPLITTVLGGSK